MKLLQPNDESLFYVRYFQYIPVPRKLYKSSLEKFKENLKEAEGISKGAHSMMDRIKKVDQSDWKRAEGLDKNREIHYCNMETVLKK